MEGRVLQMDNQSLRQQLGYMSRQIASLPSPAADTVSKEFPAGHEATAEAACLLQLSDHASLALAVYKVVAVLHSLEHTYVEDIVKGYGKLTHLL